MAEAKHKVIQRDMVNGAKTLEQALEHFGILARISSIEDGLETRRFEIELSESRAQRILDLADNIAVALGVSGIHIDAPILKNIVVSITVPKAQG